MKRQIYRTITFFFLVVVIIFSFSGCGSKEDLNKFNGIPFGITKKEAMPKIEKMLKKQGYNGEIYEEVTNYSTDYNVRVTCKNIEVVHSIIAIENYTADLIFVFKANGDDNTSIENSIFDRAYYSFPRTNLEEAEKIATILRDKFSTIYGYRDYELKNDADHIIPYSVGWFNKDMSANCDISVERLDWAEENEYHTTLYFSSYE